MNKSEEWETRKKKEITTTRQIETRVKRQVVLEDGEVIVDSGPLVTTNTTEDVEQQEHTTEERRTIGDDPTQAGGKWPATRSSPSSGGKCTLRINNSVLHGNPEDASIVQEELNETVVRSREEIEERLETEDRQQLGDISDEAYQKAVHSNRGDLRTALAESTKQLLAGAQSGPRVVQHTTRSSKVVDTEKTLERKELKADGLIVTERKRTVEHEEIKDDPVPEDETALKDGKDDVSETRKESSQRFIKKRDEDLVDYISGGERVAREMRYVAETTEGERIGDWPASSSPTTMRKTRSRTTNARKEALTKEPLDLEEEDEARKFETSRWLENHFGSEYKSSYSSIDTEIIPHPPNTTNTSYINVTMKSSCPPKERDYQNLHSSRRHHQVKQPQQQQQQQQQHGPTAVTKATIPEYSSPASPSGYFHGISEWSERYNNRENQNTNARTGSSSSRYVDSSPQYNDRGHTDGDEGRQNHVKSPNFYENINRNGYREKSQERQCTPSPPIRRKSREKKRFLITEDQGGTTNEQELLTRGASPINVIQRTWETRSRDVSKEQSTERDVQKPTRSSRSRSNSPKPTTSSSSSSKLILREENNKSSPDTPVKTRPGKSTSGQSKYKIGESFRKLVGKLRSSSLERKNKRSHVNSISQLTQTDDNEPTYLQYNVIDRNVPLVNDNRNRMIENESSLSTLSRNTTNGSNKTIKTTITKTMVERDSKEEWQHEHRSPPHRYHPNENPISTRHARSRGFGASDAIPSPMESNSLGRISKSTSRLTPDYGREEHFRSTQTLPRNLNAGGRQQQFEQERNVQTCQRAYQSAGTHSIPIRQENTLHSTSSSSSNQDRHYSSMINISIKNAVTSPSSRLINVQTPGPRGPEKPERTYRSSLSRSKSFNVEANENISSHVPFTSNSQLNRLDAAPPPLKSPGILASISRSNRDLFKENKREFLNRN